MTKGSKCPVLHLGNRATPRGQPSGPPGRVLPLVPTPDLWDSHATRSPALRLKGPTAPVSEDRGVFDWVPPKHSQRRACAGGSGGKWPQDSHDQDRESEMGGVPPKDPPCSWSRVPTGWGAYPQPGPTDPGVPTGINCPALAVDHDFEAPKGVSGRSASEGAAEAWAQAAAGGRASGCTGRKCSEPAGTG